MPASVGFADAPGGGTVFHVDLPLWNEQSDAADDDPVGTETSDPVTSRAGRHEPARDHLPSELARNA